PGLRALADGGRRLPRPRARRSAVRHGWIARHPGPDPAHHRGHEDHEPHPRTEGGGGGAYPGSQQPSRRVRGAAGHHRVNEFSRSLLALVSDKVLIANRGELALRVLPACREIGIAPVAVHSTAAAAAMYVRLADESVCIGPPQAAESYLNIPRLVAAC